MKHLRGSRSDGGSNPGAARFARWIEALDESARELVLLDGAVACQIVHDGECHLGIVGVAPRAVRDRTPSDVRIGFFSGEKEVLAKTVAYGQSKKTLPGSTELVIGLGTSAR